MGSGLRFDGFARLSSSSALALVYVQGRSLADYARGGSASQAVWIRAQQEGLAVGPTTPLFLYAHNDQELHGLSSSYGAQPQRLQLSSPNWPTPTRVSRRPSCCGSAPHRARQFAAGAGR